MSQLRFGRAIAKRRTLHGQRHYRQAMKFLRAAKKSTNSLNHSRKVNKMWSDGANLEPVLAFLAEGR